MPTEEYGSSGLPRRIYSYITQRFNDDFYSKCVISSRIRSMDCSRFADGSSMIVSSVIEVFRDSAYAFRSGNIDYYIENDHEGIAVIYGPSDQTPSLLHIPWDQYAHSVFDSIGDGTFFTSFQKEHMLFAQLLFERISSRNREHDRSLDIIRTSIDDDNDLTDLINDFIGYCASYDSLQSLLQSNGCASGEGVKNRLMMDRHFVDQASRIVYSNFNRSLMSSNDSSEVHNHIRILTFLLDIDDIADQICVPCRLGDYIRYDGKVYRIADIEDRDIVLKSGNRKICQSYLDLVYARDNHVMDVCK